MVYKKYTTEDFVLDKRFRAWVETPEKESNQFWHHFLMEHPEKLEAVKKAKAIVQNIKFREHRLSSQQVDDLWSNIQEGNRHGAIQEEGKILPLNPLYLAEQQIKNKGFHLTKHIQKLVACLTVLLMVAGLSFYYVTKGEEQVYATGYGEIRRVQLPDSSTVILNANSKISFFSDWGNDQAREVHLEGEAFFTVTHKLNDQKFIVKTTDGIEVKVLGTEFNVSDRRGETKIGLTSGKIRLTLPESPGEEEGIIMKPGELVKVDENTLSYSREIVDPEEFSSWTKQKLLLNHTSLREIASILQDNYGLKVKVEDQELWGQTVSGSMPLRNVDELIIQIAQTFQLQVTRNGDIVTIKAVL